MIDQRYFKTRDAAKYLGLTEYMLLWFAKKGEIPYSRPGGKEMFFDKADLDTFMQNHRGK